MNLKEEGHKLVINALWKVVENQRAEIRELARKNLQMREHLKVLCQHPVGLASKMIAKKYSRDCVTKELQKALLN